MSASRRLLREAMILSTLANGPMVAHELQRKLGVSRDTFRKDVQRLIAAEMIQAPRPISVGRPPKGEPRNILQLVSSEVVNSAIQRFQEETNALEKQSEMLCALQALGSLGADEATMIFAAVKRIEKKRSRS